MTATRAEVVAAARGWIGTPFHHQGRMRGVGVDCAGLVICVGHQLGLFEPRFDVEGYPRVPDGTLVSHCDEHMQRVPREAMQPGDVVVVTWDHEPMHLGILGDYLYGGLSIIHALERAGRHNGRVCEMRLLFTAHAMTYVCSYALPGVH